MAKMKHDQLVPRVLLLVGALGTHLATASDKELTIYTSSNETFIRPVFDEFTKDSGIKINFVSDKGPVLIERLKAEGAKSPADIFMTVDVGNLWLASEAGLLAPTQSAIVEKNIPSQYREPNNKWVGLSLRARTLFYNPTKVKETELKDYADLAQTNWHNRLCLRTSNNVYNQSLVASFLENFGELKTEEILKGWVKNLVSNVHTSDTLLLEAIDAGKCDVGIANTYYFARLLKDKGVKNVRVFWPSNQVHVNIMGGGILLHSKRKALALQFLEWATEAKAQQLFASMNYEYPINKEAELDPIVAAWGTFNADKMPLYKAGEKQQAAVKLMDKVGYR